MIGQPHRRHSIRAKNKCFEACHADRSKRHFFSPAMFIGFCKVKPVATFHCVGTNRFSSSVQLTTTFNCLLSEDCWSALIITKRPSGVTS